MVSPRRSAERLPFLPLYVAIFLEYWLQMVWGIPYADSGHGGQTKDLDGDEADGYDEVIYPVDFNENGHIVDDDLHMIMVINVPDPICFLWFLFR